MKSSTDKRIHIILIVITLLVAVGTLAGILLPYQDTIIVKGLRIVMGSVFILFLPGYYLTKTFFSETEIDALERFALSFALSISVIPLLTFYTNLLGLPITALNVYLITLAVIIVSILFIIFQKYRSGVTLKKEIQD